MKPYITLLSLVTASLAAPQYSETKRQPNGEDNRVAKVTLPIVSRQSGDNPVSDNTDGRVKVVKEWKDLITSINTFIDDASSLLEGPLEGRDYSIIVDGIQRIREVARGEPALITNLYNVADEADLTTEAEAAVDNLKKELEGTTEKPFGLSRIFDEMQGGASVTDVAQTQEELNGLPKFARELQPDCMVADQLKELVGIRCCILPPELTTFWRAVIFGPGLGLEVEPDVPKARACNKEDACIRTDGCGPPESTIGYRFLTTRS